MSTTSAEVRAAPSWTSDEPQTNTKNLIFVASNPKATAAAASSKTTTTTSLRRLQVQVVHRHGDRSPITSLKDEDYWAGQLIPAARLQELDQHTHVLTDGVADTHKASGRGPFGKLTALGLQQMEDLGAQLRDEFVAATTGDSGRNEARVDGQGNTVYPFLFGSSDGPNDDDECRPLQPSNLRVISTSFPRAIQSAQGVLAGLFPNGTTTKDDERIQIDARHSLILLPDPQPRQTQEQVDLEDKLAARPHLQAKEEELLPLALRVTRALHPLLAADAHEASFGATQQQQQLRRTSAESIEVEPLAWNQLGEITKCLACRDRLPPEISEQDHHDVVQHAAWRWFESFRHPRLAYLSMHEQCEKMVHYFVNHNDAEPVLTLYSAHDSTLIGLMCALKLEQPVEWPEYGSFLMMELLEVTTTTTTTALQDGEAESEKKGLYVRFSLCGELLRSMWDEPADMILLDRLVEKLRNEGKATEGMTC